MSDNLSMSVSFKKSTTKTNLKHNNRNFTEKQKEKNNHINYDRSDINEYLVQRDLKELYEEEFGPALQKYNQNQKRKDRKIDSYYQHIKNSEKTALQQEMIIQVGDKDYYQSKGGDWNIAHEVLEQWFKDFEERNPNLKVYNAVIHHDEASPHLHLNFVPVASGYKRGLEKQVSFDRAIKQQDQTLDKKRPFADWRENEVALITEQLKKIDIERKLVGTNHYKDVNDYKKSKDLEREIKGLDKDLSMKKEELLVHNNKSKIDRKLDVTAYKEMKQIEVETDEKNIFGQAKTKTVKEWTGKLLLSEEDYNSMITAIGKGRKAEAKLNDLLETDVLKENKGLKEDKERLYSEVDLLEKEKIEQTVNFLHEQEDNKHLRRRLGDAESKIDDLKHEIRLLYRTTKKFLKERTSDLNVFKSLFKDLVHDLSESLSLKGLNNHFKKEHDKESKKEKNRNRGIRR